MSQTKNKCDSLVLSRSELWIAWRCRGIPRVCCYYFCLEPTVRKDAWMRRTSVSVWHFFRKWHFETYWSQLCSKFLPNKYEAHWKQHFERYPRVEYFPDMDQLTRNIFHQAFGKHETKIDDNASKKISCTKIQVCTSKNIEPKKTTFHFFYTLFSLKTSF